MNTSLEKMVATVLAKAGDEDVPIEIKMRGETVWVDRADNWREACGCEVQLHHTPRSGAASKDLQA